MRVLFDSPGDSSRGGGTDGAVVAVLSYFLSTTTNNNKTVVSRGYACGPHARMYHVVSCTWYDIGGGHRQLPGGAHLQGPGGGSRQPVLLQSLQEPQGGGLRRNPTGLPESRKVRLFFFCYLGMYKYMDGRPPTEEEEE